MEEWRGGGVEGWRRGEGVEVWRCGGEGEGWKRRGDGQRRSEVSALETREDVQVAASVQRGEEEREEEDAGNGSRRARRPLRVFRN